MSNLTNPRALWLKGGLFVLLGLMASGLLISRAPNFINATLMAILIWSFCRAYYFAFYVIEHYVDPQFRFAGLTDFARYALLGKTPDRKENSQ